MRTFVSQSGLHWIARVVDVPYTELHRTGKVSQGERTVLRFSSGDVVLDLPEWPDDWASMGDESLLALCRRARAPIGGTREDVDHVGELTSLYQG